MGYLLEGPIFHASIMGAQKARRTAAYSMYTTMSLQMFQLLKPWNYCRLQQHTPEDVTNHTTGFCVASSHPLTANACAKIHRMSENGR